MSKNSILSETLSEIQAIREGIQKNANHVLKSTLKEDLESIIRKGLNEADEEDEMDDTDIEGDDNVGDDMASDDVGADLGDMDDMGDDEFGDEEEVDLTGASDDEVKDAFDTMQLSDTVMVTKDAGGKINITIDPEGSFGGEEVEGDEDLDMGDYEPTDFDDEDEDELKEAFYGSEERNYFGDDDYDWDRDSDMTPDYEEDFGDDVFDDDDALNLPNGDGYDDDDDIMFELYDDEMSEMDDEMSEMDDDVMLELELPEEEDVYEMKQKTEELQESLVSTRRKLRALVTENKKKVGQINKLKNTANEFAKSEKQYKGAINSLKTQLQEIALFTSNLTYAVKLMTENSTTKEEKLKILKKFDSAKNLKESKAIYESLESLLETTKKPAEKIVNEKINNKPKSSSSATLNESTAYRNPQLDRMLDIINKIK